MLIMLEQGEELVAVTMGKRDRDNQDSLTEVKDLTSQVSDGRVFVDVPNGLWCVNVIKTTRKGTGRKIILIRLIMMLCVILLIRYMSLIMHTIKTILENFCRIFL